MDLAVEQVLEARRLRGRASRRLGLVASSVLHAALFATVIVTPMLEEQARKPPRFVSIALVSAQALGVREPSPPPSQPEPRRAATPPPQPTPAPERTRPRERPAEPTPERAPSPQTATPAPPSPASGGDALQRRQGSPTGSTTGTAAFGARVGFDNPNFKHSYFIDQMTAMLSGQWVRPAIGGELVALVHFRIHRDGSVTDLEIVESSGYSSYDLAALRAVQQAAPFPPLPRSFSESSLGVTVEFI